MAVNKDSSEDDHDIATEYNRNQRVLAKIMILLVEKVMASGDEEFGCVWL
jgi:hypothetical protein